MDTTGGAPLLTVSGGKITTYRRLAESALAKLAPFFPQARSPWTARVTLPGGDFPRDQMTTLRGALMGSYPFLSDTLAGRLIHAYGTDARAIFGPATAVVDLGRDFGATLTEAGLRWRMAREWTQRAEDADWRRSKLGLRLTPDLIAELDARMAAAQGEMAGSAAQCPRRGRRLRAVGILRPAGAPVPGHRHPPAPATAPRLETRRRSGTRGRAPRGAPRPSRDSGRW